jgi:AbrB family looped-hinge helix DNA binding protein
MTRRFNRYRLVVRWTVRVRKEGGSQSITIPKHLVRRLGIAPGDRLIARLTEDGILLRPVHARRREEDRPGGV